MAKVREASTRVIYASDAKSQQTGPHTKKADACNQREANSGSSLFLQLPLEIRRRIYDATLGLPLREQLSLLSTNRQICDEGHEFIFRRPLKCSSREQLQGFVDAHEDDALNQVRCLVLRLEDLPPIAMQLYLEKVILGVPVPPEQHPYVIESERILSLVQMMPGLKHLSLLPPSQRGQKSAPKDLVQFLLSQLSQCFSRLRSLSVSTDIKSLDFLANFTHLQSLSFSGCSETEPHRAGVILKQISGLQELTIVGPSTSFLKQHNRSVQKGALLAITPDFLRNTPSLKSLKIRDLAPAGRAGFLTNDMLRAVLDTHRSTLQTLCISSMAQPSTSDLTLLKTIVLSLPALRELHLEWPIVSSDLVADCLPTSIQSLTVAVQCSIHAQNIIDELTSASHRWPYLRKSHFNMVENQDMNLAMAIQASNRYVSHQYAHVATTDSLLLG